MATHATVYVWGHGNNFQELLLSVHADVGVGDWAQINRLRGESLYLLSHCASYLMS